MKMRYVVYGMVIAIIVVTAFLVYASDTPYFEEEMDYGTLKTKIILVGEDGTEEPLMFGDPGILGVYRHDTPISGFYYILEAKCSGSAEGAIISKLYYSVKMKATQNNVVKNTWEMSTDYIISNDELWGYNTAQGYDPDQIWIPSDNTYYLILKCYVPINNPMPSSLSVGEYSLILSPSILQHTGYYNGQWTEWESSTPSSIAISFNVQSGALYIIDFGQEAELDY